MIDPIAALMNFWKAKTSLIIVIAFFIGLGTTAVFEVLYRSQHYANANLADFQDEVVRQKVFLDVSTSKMATTLSGNKDGVWAVLTQLAPVGPQYLVYNDTTLVGWTSQLLPINNLSLTFFSQPVVKLSNGWYLCSTQKKASLTVVGLKLVKVEYPYQNQYLSNSFEPPFCLSGSIPIVGREVEVAKPIFDVYGRYLFSVMLPPVSTVNAQWGRMGVFALGISLVLFIIAVNGYFKRSSGVLLKKWAWWGMVPCLLLIYWAFLVSGMYRSIETLELFSPVQFAYSGWLSSVGAFVVGSAFFAWLTYVFYRYYPSSPKAISKWMFILSLTGAVALLWLINTAVFILSEHSAEVFLFSQIVDLKGIQVFKWVGIFLLLFAFVLWFDAVLKRYLPIMGWRVFLGASLLVFAVFYAVNILVDGWMDWRSAVFFALLLTFGIYNRTKPLFTFSYRHILWLVLIVDLFAVALVFRFNMAKEKDNRKFMIETLANKLAGEQDAVAEMYMTQSERKIALDPNILDMLGNGSFYEDDLRQYLIKNYFIGYLNRYEIQLVPCWPKAELVVEGAAQTFDCYSYFAEMVNKYGDPVEGSEHFHFMKKDNGRINYFGVFRFFGDRPGLETSIFIEFTSKPFFEGLGYPELLVSDKERAQFELLKDYSYAKYVDGRLAKRTGDYLYHITSKRFGNTSPLEKSFVYANRYSHLVYSPRDGTQIVMSYPSIGLSNVLMAFSVIYILFLFSSFFILFLSRIGHQSAYSAYSIRERIQISLVAFSMMLLLAIGGSSVFYAVYQYKSKNNAMLSQRLKSVMMEMEQKVGAEKRLTLDMAEYLNFLLQNFSNVFYTDINLYGLDGKLLATSRPELYQKGVMGDFMNPLAFKTLSIEGEREFIHNESIGSLSYISAYVPFLNQKNEVLAYLNIPYFVGQDELREEVSSILVAMINAYLAFILVAIGVAFWASRQITRPLLLLQQRLSQTRLGLKNEKIQYSRPDEIGHLVDEYNRMVDELAQSADKLAKSERELAWREMAKQIAHEIKNPLTPMLLSVQYLQKAWDDKVPDFDKFIGRVTQTLIDHIRQLSVIATEFSHFAKMPSAKIERIDIAEKLLNTVALYEKSTDAQFVVEIQHLQTAFVLMDREQLLSVFNNLIKNALQSVPSGTSPIVGLSIQTDGKIVTLSVSDNGKGISDEIRHRLFTPNFTTKSSGMGLGLAITKNIVEGAGGKISFETCVGQGSTFYVSLPLVS